MATFSLSSTAWATNGYFTHGASPVEKGLAGAGNAYSQDTLAASNNPAGMVWQGNRMDVGAGIFSPRRSYSSQGGPALPANSTCNPCPFSIGDGDQKIDSENEAFLIPHFGRNWMLNDRSAIGLSIYGNGGLNTEYKGGIAILGPNPMTGTNFEAPGTFGRGTAGVDLSQLFISTTYSAMLGENSSWGVSGIVAYQRFEAKGLANFAGFSTDPTSLSNNDHDTSAGIGIRIGIQSEITPGIRLGAAYQPKIDMQEFDDYAGLFAEEGDFDIPSNFTLGASFEIGQSGILFIDYQAIKYEDVKAVSNPNRLHLAPAESGCTAGLTGGTGDGCLGGSNGAGFGWQDIEVVKIGYQWRTGEKMTWRVGYSITDQPIPKEEVVFNILAPGVIEQHYTFGFTRLLGKTSSLDFALMYAPNKSVKGTNNFDPSQEIELEMDQYELVLSYNRGFE